MIEENGVSESVTLLQEAAIKPLAKNQLIEITHVTVDKNNRYGTDLTSSDYTVVHVSTIYCSASPSVLFSSRL